MQENGCHQVNLIIFGKGTRLIYSQQYLKSIMKFNSKYSPNKKVTPAQYLAEIACERRASSLKTNLPIYFWRLDNWKSYYLYQIKIANELLKTYPVEAILFALKHKDAQRVFSLKNPLIVKLAKQYKKPNVSSEERQIDIVTNSTGKQSRKKNVLDNLK